MSDSGSVRLRRFHIRRSGVILAVILAMIASFLAPGAGAPLPTPASDGGGIEVPEHPEGTAFNPNQIKDIKAADPGANVNLIQPPTANNMGEARLSYPLDVPPGRAGMQPQLALSYNSAGTNSWTGMGWDLSTPVISLDTRWGVPRYETATETESYLLNGEQLTPLAHRGPPQARTAEKVFHTRVEGQFSRIVRHGTAPANYWWEVTEKSGSRLIFGGAADATLTDDSGNIATWALRETRDSNDNLVRYHNVVVEDGGVANARVPGRNIYPQRITYTGRGNTEGRYSVTFVRDRQRLEPRRPDVMIDARNGFKKVTADLLRRVEVKLDDSLVRAYELNYRVGAFHKTLLHSVSQLGEDGEVFTTHTFDYFDDIRGDTGDYQAFGDEAAWGVPDDGLGVGLRGNGEASAVNSSTSSNTGGHLYVGFNPTSPSKSNSAGVKVGQNSGSSDGLLALADVNGDNLPDKVFRRGGGVFYRPNLSGPTGPTRFGDTAIRLSNLPAISSERTRSSTAGAESYFGIAAQLDFVSTTTTSDRYFSDVNGDGIADLVNNGGVLFGFLDANGNPAYSANSADTPVTIGTGTASGTIVGDQTAEFQRQVDQFPLLDSVRRWVAPFDGTVRVSGRVRLIEDTSPERAAYDKADGVRVTIQHGDDELWAQRIGPADFIEFAPGGVDAVTVRRGDALYFRVQSVLDGQFDQVAWDPEIRYTSLPDTVDVNGLADNVFRASRDFTLGGRPSVVTAPLTGTLHLSGDVTKTAATTDDVTVIVSRNGTDVFRRTLPAGAGGTAPIDLDIPVTAEDTLSWRLRADSPIDAGTLRWVPRAHYTSADDGTPVTDEQGNPTLTISPPFELDLYPATTLTAPQGSFTATSTGDLTVQPGLAFDFGGAARDATVVFTVKKRGELLGKRTIAIVDGQVPDPAPLTVPITEGDQLFFDFSTLDTTLLGRLTSQSATVNGDPVPSAFHAAVEQGAFAQPYRGWGAIGYQGNRDRASAPIVQGDLVLDENFRDQLPAAPTEDDVPGFIADPKVSTPKIVVFAPQPDRNRWAGADENTFVGQDGASSSRLGQDTIDVITDAELAGATAVSRRGRTEQISTTFGASIPGVPIGAGASVSSGDSTGEVEFIDLNGDRFPDVVGSAGVQYSDMVGGLGARRGSVGGSVRESDSLAFNVSANAGSPARTSATARGQDVPAGTKLANTAKAGTEMPSLGVGGNLGGGESSTGHDLIDINGDSLPDKVFDNGTAALNLGYSFAAQAEPWAGGGEVNTGETTNAGVNLGFNTDFYGFAGGVSAALGTSVTEASLQDMNGDGLMDRVFANEGNPVGVAINTGNGFADPTPFRGSTGQVATDRNATLGGGAYFTFGFCFLFGCLVFNPGADTSAGLGKTEVALRDVNGDGYVDQVKSTKDNELVVAQNRTGRTNLLRSVDRPLGARMELDYVRDGNTVDAPESRWVLSRSTLFDGHRGDGQDLQVTTFDYRDGVYDRLEREFFGYGRVVVAQRDAGANDAVYRSMTTDYRTDSHYARGLPARSLTADGAGRPFLETTHTYRLRDVGTGGLANPASTTATVFPEVARVDRAFYEGQAGPVKTTFSEFDYDEFGNQTRAFESGDVGTADDVEKRSRYSSTLPACLARNLVGQPIFVETRGVVPSVRLRRAESTVDCASANVTQVREFLADGTAAVSDMEFFPDGNLKSVTGPANKTGQRYRLDYGYDTVVGVHIESIVDSFGYRSTATHNLKYGQPETTTDQNNQRMRLVYDRVGRIDSVTGPYEIAENRLTIDFEYHPEAEVPYSVTRHVDRTADGVRADTIDTVRFVDGLGREIQTKKDASVATGAGAGPVPVMTVSGRRTFDLVGRMVEQFYPVTEPKGAGNIAFNPAVDPVAPTRTGFDVLDRTTRTQFPDNTVTTNSYGFGPDRAGTTRFETITTDANGKQRRTYTDVRDLHTSVKEFNPAGGQPVIWTSYRYDPLSQLTSVTDDRNNVTSAEYDNFGRRTVVVSPDSGRTETRYDLAGNVIAKITAKLRATGQAVEYDYDFTRLSGIRYPVFPANNVSYTYGAPGAPDGTADRVSAVRDAAGTLTRAYGPLGEITRETRTVTAINGPARTYTTAYRFDSFNRVLRLTYPDGEVLTYDYDSGGQVNRATGVKNGFDYTYLARMDYDKFGQRVLQETGTGVRTTFGYDAADRRLATLRSQLPDGFSFQNTSYSYDDVGNVTQLRNDVPLPHGKPIGGPSVQTFGYDDLYRLTSATGEYRNRDNKLDRYSMSLGYDTIHNVTAKRQRHEIEVGSGPGTAPLSVSDVKASPAGAAEAAADGPANGPVEEPVDEPVPADPVYLPPLGPIEEPEEIATVADPVDGPVRLAAAATAVQEQRRTTYDYTYGYAGGKPHAPSAIGPVGHAYDANGNLVDAVNTLPPAPGKRRQLVWDEENRLACNQDHNRNTTLAQDPSSCGTPRQPATVRYVYDGDGNRVVKDAGPTHIYPNRNFSERNGTGYKHIFVGDTRIATKTVKSDSTFENHQFYFHNDHVGSTGFVTDEHANLTEHMEYFAFGETWVNEHPAQPTPVPYQYNAKEIDEETGLYYYGARYYNPRTQLWQSPDPIYESYLDDQAPNGGVTQPFNLATYTYSHNNPIRLTDPDGMAVNVAAAGVGAVAGAVIGAGAYAAVQWWRGEEITLRGTLAAGAGGAVSGATAGLTFGGSLVVQAGAAVGTGAVGGAASGATTAAINGEPVLEGAMQGAKIGAVTGPLGFVAGKGVQAAMGPIGVRLSNAVPAFTGGKTAGTLVTSEGAETALVSGWKGPSAAMPKGSAGMNIVTKSHVEAHAAAIMHQRGLKEATLWINRAPCPGKTGCAAMLERMIPRGSTLTLHVVPEGSGGRIVETIVVKGLE